MAQLVQAQVCGMCQQERASVCQVCRPESEQSATGERTTLSNSIDLCIARCNVNMGPGRHLSGGAASRWSQLKSTESSPTDSDRPTVSVSMRSCLSVCVQSVGVYLPVGAICWLALLCPPWRHSLESPFPIPVHLLQPHDGSISFESLRFAEYHSVHNHLYCPVLLPHWTRTTGWWYWMASRGYQPSVTLYSLTNSSLP